MIFVRDRDCQGLRTAGVRGTHISLLSLVLVVLLHTHEHCAELGGFIGRQRKIDRFPDVHGGWYS